MSLRVERFINELMSSNCYLVVDEEAKHCICIDPASEESLREIEYIQKNGLTLDYILLTHEHTDHTWGVNALVAAFPEVKIVCSEACKQNLKKECQAYFRFYYDNSDYHYTVCDVDLTTDELDWKLEWGSNVFLFIHVPGHSMGSICISIEDNLFTGDTIMQTRPYINKRNGSKAAFKHSIEMLQTIFEEDWIVYPRHGESFMLKDWIYYS